MIETYGIKIDLESLEDVCRAAGGYPIAYCQDGRISPQHVMDKIKERLDMRKEYCDEA